MLGLLPGFAAAKPAQTFTVDGRLFRSHSDEPLLDANVTITTQVLSADGQCILYEETRSSIDTRATDGVFNLQIGSDVGDPKRSAQDSGTGMSEIFQNTRAVAGVAAPGKTCAGGVAGPTGGAGRLLRLIVTPSSTGTPDTLSPDMALDSVPQAWVAETLQGYSPANFVLKSGDTMTGPLALPLNGLTIGTNQLVTLNGSVGFGTPTPASDEKISVVSGMYVDFAAQNNGTIANGLRLGGVGSGQGVASKATSGGNQYGLDLYTGFAARLSVTATGNVGVGTTVPSYKLQIAGVLAPTGDGAYDLGASGNRFNNVYAANGVIQTSDARQKTDIRDSDLGLDFVKSLRPVSYVWKTGDAHLHYGVLAQETETALREAKARSGRLKESDEVIVTHDKQSDAYGVRYTELIAPLIRAIQELDIENKKLKEENTAIKEWICAKDPDAALCSKRKEQRF